MSHAKRPQDGVLIERLGPLYWPLYIFLLAATAAGTLFSGVAMAATHDMGHDHHAHAHVTVALKADSDCPAPGRTITVSLGTGGFSQRTVAGHLCDVLQVQNTGSGPVRVALGPHDGHVAYPGFSESVAQPGRTTTVVLRTAGSYIVHDHFDDEHSMTVAVQK